MKGRILLAILIIIISKPNSAIAQIDTAMGVVEYTFLHQRDTLVQEYYQEEMFLMFGSKSSVYKSRTREKNETLLRQKIEQQMIDGLPIKLGTVSAFTKQNYYRFFNKKNPVIETEFMSNTYLFDDSVQEIKWQVLNDEKLIGNYTCQKATGYFAGRIYEAWFSPEIAISAGPWKLFGLPGLILEAMDTKQQVKFIFTGIKTVEHADMVIKPDDNTTQTTRASFNKMMLAFRENPQAFSNNTGLEIKMSKNNSNKAKSNFNNPLEKISNRK